MGYRNFVSLSVFSVFSVIAGAKPAPTYDLVLMHGRVVDGSGSAAIEADVGIRGERIERIGNLAGAKAKRRIDVRGLVVAPGFIDMLGQSEMNLLIDGRAMSKVMMGVTTEISGEGESVAPTNARQTREAAEFYKRYNLTVDWQSLAEYFHRLETQRIGINFGTYVGAAQVRELVVGFDDRRPTPAELETMRLLVAEAMQDGALGISTALQYVPGRFATTDELVELAKVAAAHGGIYATHQRSEGNAIDESLQEIFSIGRRAHIPVEIFHLKVAYRGNWGHMTDLLKKIDAARAEGLDVTADVYPYTAASTTLSASLPPWVLEGGVDRIVARLADPAVRERLKKELPKDTKEWENEYFGSGGPEGIRISSVVNPALEKYLGKKLSEIATMMGKDPMDALFDLVAADRNQIFAVYSVMAEEDLRKAIATPYVSFCTDTEAHATDGPLSGGHSHPRGWGTFPRVLSRYVRDEKLLSLEQAVHKMTELPAKRVGLKDRGILREGAYADVTVFDPITVRDVATYEDPNRYAEGIRYVITNGELSIDGGKRTAVLAGKVLRGPAYRPRARASMRKTSSNPKRS